MTDTVLEKRRFPRKTLEEPAQVLDNDTGQLLGVLEDVSRNGFSLLAEKAIRLEEVRNITLILPGPHDSSHRVSLVAECVWCHPGNKQSDHNRDFAAGFQLREINEQDAVALNYFIRDY
ncbi:MAG: PilZ domain-containing protein [Endozoicomonas sp.]